jgi:hypothetical protein
MSSKLLKWLANGVIAAVLMSTLWLAQAVNPGEHGPSLMLAQAATPIASATPVGPAASAPATATR